MAAGWLWQDLTRWVSASINSPFLISLSLISATRPVFCGEKECWYSKKEVFLSALPFLFLDAFRVRSANSFKIQITSNSHFIELLQNLSQERWHWIEYLWRSESRFLALLMSLDGMEQLRFFGCIFVGKMRACLICVVLGIPNSTPCMIWLVTQGLPVSLFINIIKGYLSKILQVGVVFVATLLKHFSLLPCPLPSPAVLWLFFPNLTILDGDRRL